jgi:hypothetical protein
LIRFDASSQKKRPLFQHRRKVTMPESNPGARKSSRTDRGKIEDVQRTVGNFLCLGVADGFE